MARKRFLSQDFYKPIADAVAAMIIKHCPPDQATSILDAGCGEGYYTNKLADALSENGISHSMTGIDISKFAIKAAASSNKRVKWFVANSSQLPVSKHSCHYLISLFSPIPEESFDQAISSDGCLLIASTGENHLIELRELLYDQVNCDSLDPCKHLETRFNPIKTQKVSYQLSLKTQQDIQDLLSMTPHYWRASPTKKQALNNLDKLTLSIDINLFLFEKKHA